MIRKLLTLTILAAVCACKPVEDKALPPGTEPQTEPVPAPAPPPEAAVEPASAANDWHFMTHGGSADLAFGDGDWAEGVILLQLSCLPNSGTVEMSWNEDGPATLASAGRTATFPARASVPARSPVFVGLRSTGAMNATIGGEQLALTGSAAGKTEIEKFFAYCTTPAPAQ
jgi:hypothetical protein